LLPFLQLYRSVGIVAKARSGFSLVGKSGRITVCVYAGQFLWAVSLASIPPFAADAMPDVPDQLDVIAVGAHPDDVEIGVGGTLASLVRQGFRVGIVDLTDGEPTPHGSIETRAAETAAATKALGVAWRENLGLVNRSLEPTLEARAKLAGVIRRTRPKWLFAPYWEDAHPDHVAATQLTEAARFWAKLSKTDLPGEPHHPQRIYYYYCIHLKLVPQPAFVLDISDQWPRKEAAIACYQSQFVVGRPTKSPTMLEGFRDEAAYWGKTIGVAHGEPFASREPIGMSTLSGLF
jgi:bacillithiol biosynthesis deacetylase BshB1